MSVSVKKMLLDTPSINQLSTVISQVAGPAFLLAAEAQFVTVLVSRMDRVVDRARYIRSLGGNEPDLRTELPTLQRRAKFLHRSIYWTVASSLITSLLVIVAFLTAFLHFQHEYGAAIMFTASLLAFVAALIAFTREIQLAFSEVQQCSTPSSTQGVA